MALNPLKQLAGQTAVYGLGTIVPRLLNYLLVPFYTRIFLEGEYGVITELYAYIAFLLVFLTYGMETSFFRYAEKEQKPEKVYNSALFSLLTTSVLFIIVIFLFLDPISKLMQYQGHQDYIIYLSLIVALDAFSALPFAYLRQQKKALRFSVIKLINVSVNIGLNLFFLWLCPKLAVSNPESFLLRLYDPEIGVGYVFISNLAASIITLILLLPLIFKFRMEISFSLLKKMLAYALPLLIIGLAGMVNEVSDKIIFKYLASVPEGITDVREYIMGQLGIYGANYKLAVLMTLFIQMFRYAAEPFFFAQAREKNAKNVYAAVMKYFTIFGLLIFLGVTLYIDLFKYFIGPEYWEGLKIVPIVLLANLFLGIFYNLSVWYKLNDITKYGAVIALTGSLITILMNVLLVPKFSYEGAAWGHFACYFTMMLISYYWGKKHFPINYDLKRILFYVALALILFGLSNFLKPEVLSYRLILNTVLLAVFVFTVYIFEKRFFIRTAD